MFACRLRYLRKSKNLNQSELGKILHVSQRSISRYESGEVFPNEVTLNNIANFFGVSTDYLLDRTSLKKYTVLHKKK